KNFCDVPYLDSIVTFDEEKEEVVIFAVNKHMTEDAETTIDLRSFEGYRVVSHTVVHDEDLDAVNTEQDPDRIVPVSVGGTKAENGILETVFQHKSWNVIRLSKRGTDGEAVS
ncbi:MAG: alpha-N-arabinofuranosidase, partial [Lachnospiraceae bacterium]|nr:alpha-N-arabinofuranosidase [Lachnospiraceae bacterium]